MLTSQSLAQTPSAFTYQGRLKLGGVPVTGTADFRVSLWNAQSGGAQIAGPIDINNISVDKGLFVVTPDFGFDIWDGGSRFIQLAVRSPAGGGSYTTLTPRQAVTAVPYALFAQQGGEWTLTNGNVWFTGGSVGVGNSAPTARLHVTGPGANGPVALFDQPSGTNFVEFRSSVVGAGFGTFLRFTNNGIASARIGSHTDGSLLLASGPQEDTKVTISATGAIGMGSAPVANARLTVNAAGFADAIHLLGGGVIRSASNLELVAAATLNIQPGGGSTLNLNPFGSGVTWIGAGGGSGDLIVGGQIGIGASIDPAFGITSLAHCQKFIGGTLWNVASDRRAKHEIELIESALERLDRLRPVSFRWKDWYLDRIPTAERGTQYNFVAQEFEEVFPGSTTPSAMMTPDGDQLLTLNTSALVPYTVAAIQELHAIVARQADEITELNARLARLEALIAAQATTNNR